MKNSIVLLTILFPGLLFAQSNPIASDDLIEIYSHEGEFNFNPLLNDIDPNGDLLIVSAYSLLCDLADSVIINNSQLFSYYPIAGSDGWDTIHYQVAKANDPNYFDEAIIVIHLIENRDYEAFETLNENNISARINTDGSLFWDFHNAVFEAPKDSQTHSIFAGFMRIGAINNDTIHMAATSYSQRDFWPGPVMFNSSYGSIQDSIWNTLWKVQRTEIEYHKNHWWEQGYLIPESLQNWPGNGDASVGQASVLAPFSDFNDNDLYEPEIGEYPIIKGDQAIYFIFNDDRKLHESTGAPSLIVEVHGLAYSFDCTEDTALSNTIFIDYNFINRSDVDYHDTWVGTFQDLDVGGNSDDYIQFDVGRNAMIGYNGDDFDADFQGTSGYGENVPAIGVVQLRGPLQDIDGLDNDIGIDDTETINGIGYGDQIIDNERRGCDRFVEYSSFNGPSSALEYYNYMKGILPNGMNMQYGDPTSGVSCKYMYPWNSDTTHWFGTWGVNPQYNSTIPNEGWSEAAEMNVPNDKTGLATTGPFTFNSGDTLNLTYAFVWARSMDTVSSVENSAYLKLEIDNIREMFFKDSTSCGHDEFTSSEEITPILTHDIYPNPVHETLFISEVSEATDYTIYNSIGSKMLSGLYQHGGLDVSHLTDGVYLLELKDDQRVSRHKFMVSK